MYTRILENDDWVVEYDAENNRYRVSYFQDYHFVDEILFDEGEWIPVSGCADCTHKECEHYGDI